MFTFSYHEKKSGHLKKLMGLFCHEKMLESEAYCTAIKLLSPKGMYSKITHLCNLKGSPLFCVF